MDREEILRRSRGENKDRDLFRDSVYLRAGSVSSLVALVLATVFFIVDTVISGVYNWGLYVIIVSFSATSSIVIASSTKSKRATVLAVLYTFAAVLLSAIYIYQLLSGLAH